MCFEQITVIKKISDKDFSFSELSILTRKSGDLQCHVVSYVCSFESSVYIYNTTWHHITEDTDLLK